MLIVRSLSSSGLEAFLNPLTSGTMCSTAVHQSTSTLSQLSLTQQTDVLIAFYSFQLPKIKKYCILVPKSSWSSIGLNSSCLAFVKQSFICSKAYIGWICSNSQPRSVYESEPLKFPKSGSFAWLLVQEHTLSCRLANILGHLNGLFAGTCGISWLVHSCFTLFNFLRMICQKSIFSFF